MNRPAQIGLNQSHPWILPYSAVALSFELAPSPVFFIQTGLHRINSFGSSVSPRCVNLPSIQSEMLPFVSSFLIYHALR